MDFFGNGVTSRNEDRRRLLFLHIGRTHTVAALFHPQTGDLQRLLWDENEKEQKIATALFIDRASGRVTVGNRAVELYRNGGGGILFEHFADALDALELPAEGSGDKEMHAYTNRALLSSFLDGMWALLSSQTLLHVNGIEREELRCVYVAVGGCFDPGQSRTERVALSLSSDAAVKVHTVELPRCMRALGIFPLWGTHGDAVYGYPDPSAPLERIGVLPSGETVIFALLSELALRKTEQKPTAVIVPSSLDPVADVMALLLETSQREGGKGARLMLRDGEDEDIAVRIRSSDLSYYLYEMPVESPHGNFCGAKGAVESFLASCRECEDALPTLLLSDPAYAPLQNKLQASGKVRFGGYDELVALRAMAASYAQEKRFFENLAKEGTQIRTFLASRMPFTKSTALLNGLLEGLKREVIAPTVNGWAGVSYDQSRAQCAFVLESKCRAYLGARMNAGGSIDRSLQIYTDINLLLSYADECYKESFVRIFGSAPASFAHDRKLYEAIASRYLSKDWKVPLLQFPPMVDLMMQGTGMFDFSGSSGALSRAKRQKVAVTLLMNLDAYVAVWSDNWRSHLQFALDGARLEPYISAVLDALTKEYQSNLEVYAASLEQ